MSKVSQRNINNFSESNLFRKKVHELIPGGSHTYSKGDDQFPELSPAAISHGKGSQVWDVDNNQYLDCSMGLTSVSLGHAYGPVINAVKKELSNGVNFQRPSALELETAEAFLSLVPQHDMIKFAKNGSIVTTAAVKLARAYTGRKLVAFPWDHPFYSYDDWFIGKTACNKGVPEEFSALTVTFKSNDISSLQQLFYQYPGQIACIITEPEKNTDSDTGAFLKEAIDLAHAQGALFIIDEMITGFKTAFPGSMTKYGLKPDMATWGKGIANGFSFCALTGIREIMQLGSIDRKGEEKVFLISTTHGGETHTLSAALATINEFKTKPVVKHNHYIGDSLITGCNKVLSEVGLTDHISITPCNWMLTFSFMDNEKLVSQGYRTLMMQEMIKRGILFQGVFVPCFSHDIQDVNYFIDAFRDSLYVYKEALANGWENYLKGEPAKPVFRRLL